MKLEEPPSQFDINLFPEVKIRKILLKRRQVVTNVFSKTDKGYEEIKTRSAGLSQRVRQILILVDGKRGIEVLRKMSPVDDLADTLQTLHEQGYIEKISASELCASAPGPALPAEKTPVPSGNAFRELPPAPGTKELELARNFMMNTLKSFTGLYASLSLLDKVNAVKSHAELRTHFDSWLNAITETRDGKHRADELRQALLQII
jgi:hypothetical protein